MVFPRLFRDSDNSREKSQISRNFWRQIRGKNGRFRRNFTGIFGANFAEKQRRNPRRKSPEKKKILEGCQIQCKKENTTVHPTQFSSQLYLFRATRKPKKNKSFTETARPVNLLFQLQFRAEHSNAINFFSLLGLLCCFAVYKARLFVIEGSNLFVNSKHCCVFDRVRAIKHVLASLQTAVSFPAPNSVTEKSSCFLRPVFHNILN